MVIVCFLLGLFMVKFGLATVSHLALPCNDYSLTGKLRSVCKLFVSPKLLLFPLLLPISPSLNLLTKLRAIFPHDKFVLTQRKTGSMAQSVLQSTTQLSLQVYIFITTNAWPSYYQLMSMILSTLVMAYPETDKYIIHIQPYSFFSVIKYMPVFLVNIAFRALSCSVFFRFFGFFYGVILMVGQGATLALVGFLTAKCWQPALTREQDFNSLLGETAVLHLLTVPCLKNSPAARYLRRFSFYASLLLNTTFILAILLACNMRLQITFSCRPIFQDCQVTWQELAMVKDINTLNIVLGSIIGTGFLSLLLDLIYLKVARPIFNVSVW